MLHEMTITVDDTVYDVLRPFVERQTIGELLRDFVYSRSAPPAYTKAELEAGYRAMDDDEEREAESQEWCNALIGDIDLDDDVTGKLNGYYASHKPESDSGIQQAAYRLFARENW
jgi:hypothetical protein